MEFVEVKKIEVYTELEENDKICQTLPTLKKLRDIMKDKKIKAVFKDFNENFYLIDYNDLSKFILFLEYLSSDNVTLE